MAEPQLNVLLSPEKLHSRIVDLARQVTEDYAGKTIHAVCVLENGFLFMSDLVRLVGVPVVCQFVKPHFRQKLENNIATTEIFYSPEMDVEGRDVLIVEGIIQSGLTTDFLIRNFLTRGASSVRVATLLDRQSQRRVNLLPDYFGFLVDEVYLVGYGLAGPHHHGRNLPYVAVWKGKPIPGQEPGTLF